MTFYKIFDIIFIEIEEKGVNEIVLTQKQEEALKITVERYKHGERYTVISGYAGVGKSTVVKFIIEALGLIPDEEVAYITFTGKAAKVLQKYGNPNATTAHKLLYRSRQLPTGKYVYQPRQMLENPNLKLIVVDEVSMLPNDLWELLLSHHIYVIALGDPAQLPPINKDSDNHVLDHPHVFLDEIMRQAQDSGIIRLTMDIRAGKPLSKCDWDDVKVINKSDLVEGMYTWANQIIVATNRQKIKVNNYVRQLNGRSDDPQPQDKIICLRNNWDIMDTTNQYPIVNGTTGYIDTIQFDTRTYPVWGLNGPVPVAIIGFTTEEDEHYEGIISDKNVYSTGNLTLSPAQEYSIKKLGAIPPLEINYGYAVTCHKAQGDQYSKVLVLEEYWPNIGDEHKRWLYTAATRAIDKLVIVKN